MGTGVTRRSPRIAKLADAKAAAPNPAAKRKLATVRAGAVRLSSAAVNASIDALGRRNGARPRAAEVLRVLNEVASDQPTIDNSVDVQLYRKAATRAADHEAGWRTGRPMVFVPGSSHGGAAKDTRLKKNTFEAHVTEVTSSRGGNLIKFTITETYKTRGRNRKELQRTTALEDTYTKFLEHCAELQGVVYPKRGTNNRTQAARGARRGAKAPPPGLSACGRSAGGVGEKRPYRAFARSPSLPPKGVGRLRRLRAEASSAIVVNQLTMQQVRNSQDTFDPDVDEPGDTAHLSPWDTAAILEASVLELKQDVQKRENNLAGIAATLTKEVFSRGEFRDELLACATKSKEVLQALLLAPLETSKRSTRCTASARLSSVSTRASMPRSLR